MRFRCGGFGVRVSGIKIGASGRTALVFQSLCLTIGLGILGSTAWGLPSGIALGIAVRPPKKGWVVLVREIPFTRESWERIKAPWRSLGTLSPKPLQRPRILVPIASFRRLLGEPVLAFDLGEACPNPPKNPPLQPAMFILSTFTPRSLALRWGAGMNTDHGCSAFRERLCSGPS